MSSVSACPGLLFATLVVQLAQANGVAIVGRSGGKKEGGGGETCSPTDSDCHTATTKFITTTMIVSGPASSTSASQPSNSTTPTPSSSTPLSSSGTPTSSNQSTSPTPTTAQLDSNLVKRPSISTGGIVGAVIGSLIILGLALLLLSKYVSRSRKVRKRPKEVVQPGSFPPSGPQSPTTEMSQTQFSGPVLSSDLVAQATSGPYPHPAPYYSTSESSKTSTFASSTPLLPTTGAAVTRSVTSSSARRTSLTNTDGSSDTGQPLSSPYDTATLSSWHASQTSSAHGINSSLAAAAVAAATASPNASPLHQSMAAFQKALEEENTKANSTAEANMHDPPPQYNP